jgi:hypothetical protein
MKKKRLSKFYEKKQQRFYIFLTNKAMTKKIKLLKNILILILIVFFFNPAKSQTYLYEDFELGDIPDGWSQIKYGTAYNWEYIDGGYSTSSLAGTGHPNYAKEGFKNALFHIETQSLYRVKLVTAPIDLSFGIKPELAFWHAQDERFTYEEWNNDELRVFYKEHIDSSWKLLAEYTEVVTVWKERKIQLPDSTLSGTYYIAFEGKSVNGYGVCIDSVIVEEKGIIPKYIESIDIRQASTEFVATESEDNQIIRIDFTVKGNDGVLKLDSLAVNSLNTDDSDLSANGVKIYASDDNIFSNSIQIGTGKNFVDGIVNFTGINKTLPTGISSVWITYDIAADVGHQKHEHILDAKILENNIKINSSYYPNISQSPYGERTIFESILFDNFETDKGWVFTGEFEKAKPQGLGGNTKGSPDPDYAVSGEYIIGTDITGQGESLGDYENNLTDKAYTATSPYLNCKYYKDVSLYFDRWFNMDSYDTATIDFNTDRADNWHKFWQNSGTAINNNWSYISYDVGNSINRKDSVKIRFTLGPSNSFWNYSGWNIDNVVIVGNYISKDVSVTEWLGPFSGCGHTDNEYITVKIKNFAGEPMDEDLPISFSFDNGVTIYTDTIKTSIAVDDSLVYMITKPIDLTTPGWYNNVYATTNLQGDEDNSNNRFNTEIFITPTYTLPYFEDFESNFGYYLTGGENSTWEYGTPAAVLIDSAASGSKAWVTNLDGDYSNEESSYLLSPCFNFAGLDSIVFEFKCIGISEDKTDGLSLSYSLNDGESWVLLPNKQDFYWNWYTENLISTSGTAGIDTTNGVWETFRQILPAELSNQSSVKFKFNFKSSLDNSEEGFGIDDIRIYKAPYDVGVSSIDAPTTACIIGADTEVGVYVDNYGINIIESGTKIPLTLKFDAQTINDTLQLTGPLNPGDSTLFTFGTTVDMSYAGDYDFTVYTKKEKDTYFYNQTVSNDTIYDTISVIGMPNYNPFNDQMGLNPIDTLLDAGDGYLSYAWDIPSGTADTQTFHVSEEGMHYVAVTNDSLCTAIDSTEIVNSTTNLSMDSLYNVVDSLCERASSMDLTVYFRNKSTTAYDVGDTILLGFQINDLPVVKDSMFLTKPLALNDTAKFTYNTQADFTAPGEYTLKVFTNFLIDLNHNNDTISETFLTRGYVEIDMNYDTVYSSEADTLELIATAGYSDYTWNVAGTTNIINPTDNQSRWYKVTVTDDFACGDDYDSTYVETYDFGLNSIINPVDACGHITTEAIEISVHNYSGNTYLTGTKIPFRFNFNSSGWQNDTALLTSDMVPDEDRTLTLTNTVNANSDAGYTFDIELNAEQDANTLNDIMNGDFETYGYPEVTLPYDTIYTTKADTVILIAESGFASYNWNNGTIGNILDITTKDSRNYIVTAEDYNGCITSKDSTQIITYNLGVSDIIRPINACDHSTSEIVRIEIQNTSLDTMVIGEIINVSYAINNETPINESFPLPFTFLPNQKVEYQFNEKVDLSELGLYTFKVYSDFVLDVNRLNDTLIDAINTYGYPTIDIGSDYYSTKPDTIQIVAEPGFVKYVWSNGVENDTLNITYPATKQYSITVTNTNGCSASDDLKVYTYDVLADSLNSPITKCELTASETISIGVTNNGVDTLLINEPVEVGYRLNSGTYVSEVFTLGKTLYPDSTEVFTMTETVDLSAIQTHEFKLFAKLTNVDVETNDTATKTVNYLRPIFDLGGPQESNVEDYEIDAGASFESYDWFDGSTTTQTYTVNVNEQNPNYYYAVTVTNSYGCEASDSLMLTFTILADLSITQLDEPIADCWVDGKKHAVKIEVSNVGGVNLNTNTKFTLGYTIDDGTPETDTITLASPFNASTSFDYEFEDSITFPSGKVYEFKPFVKFESDGDNTNDTLTSNNTVDISAPEVDFGTDTVTFTDNYTITLGEPYDEYIWSTNETSATITITETGDYSVTVTDENGCQASGTLHCRKPTGIDDFIHGNGYSISYYPNPASDELRIDISNTYPKDLSIEIINIQGQVLQNKKYKNSLNTVERIDVSPYSKGVYYIRFKIDDKFYIRKLIIQ